MVGVGLFGAKICYFDWRGMRHFVPGDRKIFPPGEAW